MGRVASGLQRGFTALNDAFKRISGWLRGLGIGSRLDVRRCIWKEEGTLLQQLF
jgi:hypothetical protein